MENKEEHNVVNAADLKLHSVDTILPSSGVFARPCAASFRYMTKMYFQKDNFFKRIVKLIKRFIIDLKIKTIANKLVKIGYAKKTMSGNYIIEFKEAAKYTNTSLEFIELYQNDIVDRISFHEKILVASNMWLDLNAFDMHFRCDLEE